jgi:hypothetical protein
LGDDTSLAEVASPQNRKTPTSVLLAGVLHQMAGQVRQYSNFLATISAEEWALLGALGGAR